MTQATSPAFGGDGVARYSYDVLDNLRTVKVGSRDQRYDYDASNRLTNVRDNTISNNPTVVGLGYDVQGNLQNRNGQTYQFDYGNRLREVTNVERYRYDGYGRRILSLELSASSILSQYANSGQLMYQSNVKTLTNSDYVYLGGSLIAQRDVPNGGTSATITYQHTDALGSPVAKTNADRVVIERTRYEPYGQQIGGTLKDGPGYTGHVLDKATGLNYMQQRYYCAECGRFLSVDPVAAYGGNSKHFNRYWYAAGNPYRFYDPDGRCTGSRIENDNGTCASTGTNTTMSSTAVTAQKFDSSRVQFANGANSSNSQSQAGTAVKDANRVGGMATQSEDSRLIRAFNRIKDLVVDGQNFDKVSKGAIAFTTYDGNINFSLKYFGLDTYQRTGRFIHEVFHHDDAFYAMRLQNAPGCSGWSCADEPPVEVEAMKFMRNNWKPEYFNEETTP